MANHNEYSFYHEMQQAKELAHARRQKGLPAGQHPSWNYERSPMTNLDRLYMATYQLETELGRYREWQYSALAAVESALFAYELEETY